MACVNIFLRAWQLVYIYSSLQTLFFLIFNFLRNTVSLYQYLSLSFNLVLINRMEEQRKHFWNYRMRLIAKLKMMEKRTSFMKVGNEMGNLVRCSIIILVPTSNSLGGG